MRKISKNKEYEKLANEDVEKWENRELGGDPKHAKSSEFKRTKDNFMKLPILEIQKFCKQESITYMAVFGSVAKGNDRKDSDIDILVPFSDEDNMGLLQFIGVKQRLEDLLGRRIDLVSKKALNSKIKDSVLSSAKEIYPHAA